ncbi:hypothetical protein ACP8X1_24755, partial [Escherichia coli]
ESITDLPLVARHTSPSEIIILYYLTIPFGIGSKNIHYLNALSEILFLSPVVSGHSGYFSRLFYFCYAEVL